MTAQHSRFSSLQALPVVAALLVGVAGCVEVEAPATAIDCSDLSPDGLTGQVTVGPTSHAVGEALEVAGTLDHADGLAVREVRVAGAVAQNLGFNYDSWQATVPWTGLVQLADADGGDEATVRVVARDACEQEVEVASFTVTVDRTPDVKVRELDVDVELPRGESYLPADGSATAVVTLVANPEATGAAASLSASSGLFAGVGDDRADLVFGGNGVAQATASALFVPDTEGTVTFAAAAGGFVETATVRVAGPPALVPSSGLVHAGGVLVVSLFGEGRVTGCSAYAPAGVSVTSGGVDLTQQRAVFDSDDDGRLDVVIAADADLDSGVLVDVTCEDAWGQVGTGRYSASP